VSQVPFDWILLDEWANMSLPRSWERAPGEGAAASEPSSILVALAPPGKGALATLGLAGPRAWPVVRELFRPRRGELPLAPEAGRFWLGRIGDDVRDDAVLAVPRVEPVVCVEIHVHGGREVVRWLTELFAVRGLEARTWPDHAGEGRLDALLGAHLANAPTVRTAAIVLDQASGALRRALQELLAHLEAGDQEQYAARLRDLRRWQRLGAHLTTSWRVVLAGAPNVGKSSLLNALAGYQRSIVAPTPGTTRDVVTATLAIDGWPVEVCDTAGLREGGENLEDEGVALAREAAAGANLCLWLLDASSEPVWPPEGLSNVRLVVNKIDRQAAWDLSRAHDAVRVSATTGQGLDELCAAVSRWLVPEAPAAGTAVWLPGLEELDDPERARAVLRSLLGTTASGVA
jgi:tRNA modification GTPase